MKKFMVFVAIFGLMACSTSSDQQHTEEGDDEAQAQAVEAEADDGERAQADSAGPDGDEDGPDVRQGEQPAESDQQGGQPQERDSDSDVADRQDSDAQLWSEDGLDVQPRMARLIEEGPDFHEPETTPWRPSERDIPAELSDGDEADIGEPAGVLFALIQAQDVAGQLGTEVWEQTTRIYTDGPDRATGVIMLWGFKDDSVAGSDLRVEMSREDGVWVIDDLQERFHCRRGTSGELCV